jgi:hypothetical protein
MRRSMQRAGGSAVRIPRNRLRPSPRAIFPPNEGQGARKRSHGLHQAACRWFPNCASKYTLATDPSSAASRSTGVHQDRHHSAARHGTRSMNRPILGLVGPSVLAYRGKCRVKTPKWQTESIGPAPDLFYIDGRRDPTGFEALALAPSGLEVWNGPDVKGGRVSLDPLGAPLSILLVGGSHATRRGRLAWGGRPRRRHRPSR